MYREIKKPVMEHTLSLLIGGLGVVISLSLVTGQLMV